MPTAAPLSLPTQEGTLFEADFSLLNGIKANVIQSSQQYLAAPLVMLKLQPDGQLLPMAIQVSGPGGVPRVASSDEPAVQVLSPFSVVPFPKHRGGTRGGDGQALTLRGVWLERQAP